MIVATAGHVDHGKTTLIKALTGVDTTHLPEERKRGMTIDLGFAGMALPGGGFIGFIDVPGHERFVRNMLAGITGVDLALLVVAADDGIMPQTLEHVEILDLLGVTEAAVAVTKIDRAEPAQVAVLLSRSCLPRRIWRARRSFLYRFPAIKESLRCVIISSAVPLTLADIDMVRCSAYPSIAASSWTAPAWSSPAPSLREGCVSAMRSA